VKDGDGEHKNALDLTGFEHMIYCMGVSCLDVD